MDIQQSTVRTRKRVQLPEHEKTMVLASWGLILAGWVLWPLAPIVAVIIASLSSKDTEDFATRTHYSALKKTFWVGFVLTLLVPVTFLLSMPLKNPGISLALSLLMGGLATIYCTVKSIKGLVTASKNRCYV